jgi:predicted dehydrogenase
MSAPLRIALLGAGKMAIQHGAAIRHCTGAELVAVVDPAVTADEIQARFGAGVRSFTDAATMLAEVRPDVVHVVTPPATHAALAHQCLAAGANVYVEKPFALSVGEAEAVLADARARGLRACAAHQVMFQEPGRAWRRHLAMIGEIVHVESFFSFRPVRRRTGGGGLSAPVGVNHEKWTERPLLIVVPREERAIEKLKLLEWFKGKVADWWIPDDVVIVDEIPHTATGKISKLTLREQFKEYRL